MSTTDKNLSPIQRLVNALRDPGPAPELHHRAMLKLRSEWPALYNAVQAVVAEEELRRSSAQGPSRPAPIELQIRVEPHNTIPAFAAFVAREFNEQLYEDREFDMPRILINFRASALACAEHTELRFSDLVAENVLHEMMHLLQELFGRAFDEGEVNRLLDALRAEGDKHEPFEVPWTMAPALELPPTLPAIEHDVNPDDGTVLNGYDGVVTTFAPLVQGFLVCDSEERKMEGFVRFIGDYADEYVDIRVPVTEIVRIAEWAKA